MRERARSRVVCLMIMNHFTERRGGNYPSLNPMVCTLRMTIVILLIGFLHDTMMASVFERSSRLYFLPSFLPLLLQPTAFAVARKSLPPG